MWVTVDSAYGWSKMVESHHVVKKENPSQEQVGRITWRCRLIILSGILFLIIVKNFKTVCKDDSSYITQLKQPK